METEVVSSFFTSSSGESSSEDISDKFLHLVDELNLSLEQFQMPERVKAVYNPTIYAREPLEMYVRKYCNTPKPIIFFGMNPGPFGMSQTGVPFGEIKAVRDWLGITGSVGKPPVEVKRREVLGFECKRSEKPEVQELYRICDRVFHKVLELYEVEIIVAIGKFCETRAKETLNTFSLSKPIKILYMQHPSPRVRNNNNWIEKNILFFKENNLLQYYKQPSV
ncbi:unnamed protein product [Spodoptera littoralis]|uniref:Uracil-DNA glycosylase-like domain-containing protein n=1 Tax=Spodoptera littoralis TaxID=7109 RepID=A0A9P0N136_SPOLI|nr:unnamed protein product [Spodoptera littoralis]CAH1637655.1 unnamed protein product [Spodoptera littoralis]